MLQIFTHANYDFIGKRRIAYAISIAFTLVGVIHIAYKGGLAAGIDFAGGTLIQVRFEQPVTVEQIRAALDRVKLGTAIIQRFGDPREYLIRTQLTGEPLEELTHRTEQALATSVAKLEVRRVESVGPQVGRDLQFQALYAVLAGMAGILVYVAFRFDFKGGVAAVIALMHDVIVVLGAISLTNREMSLPVLAALLTIVGYSINDTIVVFDRIRENRGRAPKKGQTIGEVFNTAMNQTLSRTMLTSLTVFLTVLVLYVFGGEVLRDFAFALLVGVITGTYSSVFVAAPIVVDWENWLASRGRAKKAVAKA
jgi:preprotein translocase subunit SecF